jgi:Ras-related protein Rab-1A
MIGDLESTVYTHPLKFVIIGDSGVGKSSMVMRFADGEFKEDYISTIGVDFRTKTMNIDGKPVRLQIWDTAGQERFRSISSAYYRGADGVIFCYDITNQNTFDNIKEWIYELRKHYDERTAIAKIVVGNKADLENKRKVTTEVGQQFADSMGFAFIEASAKTSTNVDAAFEMVVRKLIEMGVDRTTRVRVKPKRSMKDMNPTCCN